MIPALSVAVLIVFLLVGWLTAWEFLAATSALLAAFVLFAPDISELTLAKVFQLKRDVQAVQETRKQVEAHAEEIRAIRDQVEATQGDVAEQARSIEESAERIEESERELTKAQRDLQLLACKLHEAVVVVFTSSSALSLLALKPSTEPDDKREARLVQAFAVIADVVPLLESTTEIVVSLDEIDRDSIHVEPFDYEALLDKAGLSRTQLD